MKSKICAVLFAIVFLTTVSSRAADPLKRATVGAKANITSFFLGQVASKLKLNERENTLLPKEAGEKAASENLLQSCFRLGGHQQDIYAVLADLDDLEIPYGDLKRTTVELDRYCGRENGDLSIFEASQKQYEQISEIRRQLKRIAKQLDPNQPQ